MGNCYMENKEYKIVITTTSEGYLWYSDAEKPVVFEKDSSQVIILKDTDNPFVVEGQLYDSGTKESCSIKYVDGHYLVSRFQVKDEEKSHPDNEIKSYLSNRMEGRYLYFLRYWVAFPDDYCMGKEVLKMAKDVFIGFTKK